MQCRRKLDDDYGLPHLVKLNFFFSHSPCIAPDLLGLLGLGRGEGVGGWEGLADEGRNIPSHPLLDEGSASFSDLSVIESGKFPLNCKSPLGLFRLIFSFSLTVLPRHLSLTFLAGTAANQTPDV